MKKTTKKRPIVARQNELCKLLADKVRYVKMIRETFGPASGEEQEIIERQERFAIHHGREALRAVEKRDAAGAARHTMLVGDAVAAITLRHIGKQDPMQSIFDHLDYRAIQAGRRRGKGDVTDKMLERMSELITRGRIRKQPAAKRVAGDKMLNPEQIHFRTILNAWNKKEN